MDVYQFWSSHMLRAAAQAPHDPAYLIAWVHKCRLGKYRPRRQRRPRSVRILWYTLSVLCPISLHTANTTTMAIPFVVRHIRIANRRFGCGTDAISFRVYRSFSENAHFLLRLRNLILARVSLTLQILS